MPHIRLEPSQLEGAIRHRRVSPARSTDPIAMLLGIFLVLQLLAPASAFGAQKADRVFMSGLVLERQGLGGHPAVVSVPLGQGNIVLFGIRTLHRNQTRGSFALAWNAVLNWDGLEMAPTPAAAADADAASGEEP